MIDQIFQSDSKFQSNSNQQQTPYFLNDIIQLTGQSQYIDKQDQFQILCESSVQQPMCCRCIKTNCDRKYCQCLRNKIKCKNCKNCYCKNLQRNNFIFQTTFQDFWLYNYKQILKDEAKNREGNAERDKSKKTIQINIKSCQVNANKNRKIVSSSHRHPCQKYSLNTKNAQKCKEKPRI